MGWVPASTVAKVSAAFIHYWQNSHFVTATVRAQTIQTLQGDKPLYFGSILPSPNFHSVIVTLKDSTGMAVTEVMPMINLAMTIGLWRQPLGILLHKLMR